MEISGWGGQYMLINMEFVTQCEGKAAASAAAWIKCIYTDIFQWRRI
jgi:hypothetical protein